MRRLLWFHTIAALLLASWFFPPTSLLWHRLDVWLFETLNGTLAGHPRWQWTVAIFSCSKLDLLQAAYLGVLACIYLIGGGRKDLVVRTLLFGLTALFFFETIKQMHHLLDYLGWNRQSPTLVLEPKVWLSRTVVTGLNIRDNSTTCFPGDHAMTLYFWTAYFWRYGGRKLGVAALGLAILFSIPRLIGGAHWLSDELVGSVSCVLVLFSWSALVHPRLELRLNSLWHLLSRRRVKADPA